MWKPVFCLFTLLIWSPWESLDGLQKPYHLIIYLLSPPSDTKWLLKHFHFPFLFHVLQPTFFLLIFFLQSIMEYLFTKCYFSWIASIFWRVQSKQSFEAVRLHFIYAWITQITWKWPSLFFSDLDRKTASGQRLCQTVHAKFPVFVPAGFCSQVVNLQ